MSLLSAASAPTPRDSALLHSLASAGHEVTMARPDRSRFGRERMRAHSAWTATGSRPLPSPRRARPEVIHAGSSKIVATADRLAQRLGAWVSRRPDWPVATRDWIWAVPGRPELSVPPGQPVPETEPWLPHAGADLEPDRHSSRAVVLCYRPTPASPARALQAALTRAGVTVHTTDSLDFGEVAGIDLVVFVESPTPPIPIRGRNPGVPVAFWVHHGEHHLDGNLRLARRYGADLVLLAHSWHLAARFDRPVERFPFGGDPAPGAVPFRKRDWDLAFIGVLEGSAYARRKALIDEARATLPKVYAGSGIHPSEIPAVYGNSRSVLNEGGTRHLPITMRVFEAVSAGALLVTEPAPGLDLLFDGCYLPFDDAGIDVRRLAEVLEGGEGQALAEEGRRRLERAHTYDHRVDQLFRHADTLPAAHQPPPAPADPVERFLWDHPYGQRILDLTGSLDAPDREVWRLADLPGEPGTGTFDTVLMDSRSSLDHARAARRYVIGYGLDVSALPVSARRVEEHGSLRVIDVGGPGYDVDTVGGR